MSPPDLLSRLLEQELGRPAAPEARAIAEHVLRRHGSAVRAVLFYGAGFREAPDPDAVLDLCVLVTSYREVATNRILALANHLLPPNVFFVEVPFEGRTVRAKYGLVTLEDFARRTGPGSMDPYFWARFAQPSVLAHVRSARDERAVVAAVRAAVLRFLGCALPLVAATFTPRDLWVAVFRQTYRSELRPERDDRPGSLHDAFAERYERVTRAALPFVPGLIEGEAAGELRSTLTPAERRLGRLAWALRRRTGKLLAVLRLGKALFTFEGGIDYAFWKIARHTGTPIDPGERAGVFRLLRLWVAYLRSGGAPRRPANAAGEGPQPAESAEARKRKTVSSKPPASYA